MTIETVNFVTYLNKNIYCKCESNCTIKQIIDSFLLNYSCTGLSNDDIYFYSCDLDRVLTHQDMNRQICSFATKNFKLLQSHQIYKYDNYENISHKINNSINKFSVFVFYLNGKIDKITVCNELTFNDLKVIIGKINGSDPGQFRIMFERTQLREDSGTLQNLGIVNGSKLYLVFRLRPGPWQETTGPNGNYLELQNGFTFEVPESDPDNLFIVI